ncbi:unnamed protein product [Periconia digitata]|uniref:Uncharacterized protein n=1 Tax=Periconia digitata TaxID=1303443 RepID=A0A9W4XF26_9PLEO|nr:unnamed protein product [Periconia digitata]
MDCNYDPSWTFDSQACLALPTDAVTSTSDFVLYNPRRVTPTTLTKYSRYIGLTERTNPTSQTTLTQMGYNPDIYMNPTGPTPTQFNGCLPGPTSCSERYTGEACPTPYEEIYVEVYESMRTAYCCFSLTSSNADRFFPRYTLPVKYSEAPASETFNTVVDLCVYSWAAKDPLSMFPLERIPPRPEVYPHQYQLTMRPFKVHWNESAPPVPVKSGLETSAKISIGVGVGVGAFVLIATITSIVYLLRRLRQQKMRAEDSEDSATIKAELPSHHVSEAQGQNIYQLSDRLTAELTGECTEMDGVARAEMAGCDSGKWIKANQVHEMQDTSLPAEVSGDIKYKK